MVIPAARKPKVFFLGDSHATAVVKALQAMADEALPFAPFASRFTKTKEGGATIEGLTMDEALDMLRDSGSEDLLVSMVGGNQFNIIGLMRHPRPFDFVEPHAAAPVDREDALIPFRVIEQMFDKFLGGVDETLLGRARHVFRGRLAHASPPPPKEDDEFIRTNAETRFRSSGIEHIGVSKPALRRKLWSAQFRALQRQYEPIGARVLAPPPQSVDPNGFLVREAYGQDATHANALYGRWVVDQVAALVTEQQPVEERA